MFYTVNSDSHSFAVLFYSLFTHSCFVLNFDRGLLLEPNWPGTHGCQQEVSERKELQEFVDSAWGMLSQESVILGT